MKSSGAYSLNQNPTYRITNSTVSICSPSLDKKYKFFIDNNINLSCDCDNTPCDCFWWYEGPTKKPVKPKHIEEIINSLILKKYVFFEEGDGTKENPLKIETIFPKFK